MASYAQIDTTQKTAIIINVILADAEDTFDSNFTWIDITKISPQPSLNWTYDGINFTPPPLPPPPILTSAQKLQNAQAFGSNLLNQAIGYNSQLGLSGAQRLQLQQILLPIAFALFTGDLATAYAGIQTVTIDGVLVTQGLVNLIQPQLKNYLGL